MKVQKIFQAIESELTLVNTRRKELDLKKFAKENTIPSSFPMLSQEIPDYSRMEYNIEELVSIPSVYFIEALYLSLLKRSPDDGGHRFYQKELLKGISKAEIIARMAYSKEVRSKKIKVRGVFLPAMRFAISKIPVISTLIEFIYALLKLPKLEKELRGLRNQIDFKEHMLKLAIDDLTRNSSVRFEHYRKASHVNFMNIQDRFYKLDLDQNKVAPLAKDDLNVKGIKVKKRNSVSKIK